MREDTCARRGAGAAFAALLASLLSAAPARAQQPFIPFTARSLGLGGAAVALEGATFLDNPALAGDSTAVSAWFSLGGTGIENGSFVDPLSTVSDSSVESLAGGADPSAVLASLQTLSVPGNGILGTGRVGPAVSFGGWGIALAEYEWTGTLARTDLVHVLPGIDPATSWLGNTSVAAFRGLSMRDLAIARAYRSGPIAVGLTVHVLRGTTFSKEEGAFVTEVSDVYRLARRGLTGVERTRTRFTYDLGAALIFGAFRLGFVTKALNRPVFPFDEQTAPVADRGGQVRYGRQSRAGAAFHLPGSGITLAADLDLVKADTLVPGLKSREVGGGLEGRLGPFVLRGGASTNLEAPVKKPVYSAGLGLTFPTVRIDVSGNYKSDKAALGGVATVTAGF